jgi:hypothetical protein
MLEYTPEHEWKEPWSLSVMEGSLSFNARPAETSSGEPNGARLETKYLVRL